MFVQTPLVSDSSKASQEKTRLAALRQIQKSAREHRVATGSLNDDERWAAIRSTFKVTRAVEKVTTVKFTVVRDGAHLAELLNV